jgi:hypothetical protein
MLPINPLFIIAESASVDCIQRPSPLFSFFGKGKSQQKQPQKKRERHDRQPASLDDAGAHGAIALGRVGLKPCVAYQALEDHLGTNPQRERGDKGENYHAAENELLVGFVFVIHRVPSSRSRVWQLFQESGQKEHERQKGDDSTHDPQANFHQQFALHVSNRDTLCSDTFQQN